MKEVKPTLNYETSTKEPASRLEAIIFWVAYCLIAALLAGAVLEVSLMHRR